MALLVACVIPCVTSATPIGNEYFVTGVNFPGTFSLAGPFTFNAPGDPTLEGTPGVLTVREALAPNPGPSGGELVLFSFRLGIPADPNLGFSVGIHGLDWGSGMMAQLISSFVRVDFGTAGRTRIVNTTAFTTSAFVPPPGAHAGLAATMSSGSISWANILASVGGGTPSSLSVQYALEIIHVPEPGTLAMLALAVTLIPLTKRVRRR